MLDLCGWVQNEAAVELVCSALPNPVFNFGAPAAVDVFLHKFYKEITGKDPEAGPQLIGDCVSWGFSRFVDFEQALDVMFDTNPDAELKLEITCTEATYGGSRCQIGGQWGSRQDGSVGAWAAKLFTDYGAISRNELARLGMSPDYSGQRAKDWGANGIPKNIIPNLKKMKEMSLVRSFDEFCAVNQQYRTVAVCSNVGFENGNGRPALTQRDKDGFATPRGTWNHCMHFVSSIRTGSRPGALCLNQWPLSSIAGPKAHDQPDMSFWVDADVVDRMLRQGDSFTGSAFAGYPVRKLTYQS